MKATATVDRYVLDTLLPDLVGHDRSPSAFLVYLVVYGQTGGGRRKTVALSHQGLAEATGLSKSAVQAAVRLLTRRKLLTSRRASKTAVPEHAVLRPWRR